MLNSRIDTKSIRKPPLKVFSRHEERFQGLLSFRKFYRTGLAKKVSRLANHVVQIQIQIQKGSLRSKVKFGAHEERS